MVKAQIHAGGRGKAGGVKVVKDLNEVKNSVKFITICCLKKINSFKFFHYCLDV